MVITLLVKFIVILKKRKPVFNYKKLKRKQVRPTMGFRERSVCRFIFRINLTIPF